MKNECIETVTITLKKQLVVESFSKAFSNGCTKMVFWIYPEVLEDQDLLTNNNFLTEVKCIEQRIEPATRYENDNDKYKVNKVYPLTTETLALVNANWKKLEKVFDSTTFYLPRHKRWYCGVVYHENLLFYRNK